MHKLSLKMVPLGITSLYYKIVSLDSLRLTKEQKIRKLILLCCINMLKPATGWLASYFLQVNLIWSYALLRLIYSDFLTELLILNNIITWKAKHGTYYSCITTVPISVTNSSSFSSVQYFNSAASTVWAINKAHCHF